MRPERTPKSARAGKKNLRLLLPFAFVLIPALLAYLFRLVLAAFPAFTERVWSRFLFRSISTPISWITSLLPFSLTELSVVALPFLLLCGLVLLAFALVRRTGRRLAILYTTALDIRFPAHVTCEPPAGTRQTFDPDIPLIFVNTLP